MRQRRFHGFNGNANAFTDELVHSRNLGKRIADESDRIGVRVVIELKRDATPDVVLNQLFGADARPLGVSPAVKPTGGQPARASAAICATSVKPVALHGDLSAFCG